MSRPIWQQWGPWKVRRNLIVKHVECPLRRMEFILQSLGAIRKLVGLQCNDWGTWAAQTAGERSWRLGNKYEVLAVVLVGADKAFYPAASVGREGKDLCSSTVF